MHRKVQTEIIHLATTILGLHEARFSKGFFHVGNKPLQITGGEVGIENVQDYRL